jgi:hypothetical protein
VDVGVDLVDMGFGLVLDLKLVYLDIHLVITLNYGGLDSIGSPGLTLR